ncbi:hypothetical protein [Fuscibacter oryzae]|uniref:Uncharacterized protein n=1 Tax=Fuscibacter oryzae TaxID=2803939 RepID=A0A8J7STN7_9RHOB|nr:hypothetical protein [Fuscibacter oryzae]MBL4929391.1 hypothetical protein [Fuscibacter oryzae]
MSNCDVRAVKGGFAGELYAAVFAVVLFYLPAPLEAGEWQVLYMADTGGSRLWATDDPAEATEIIARVISPDFAVLSTSCQKAPSGFTYLSIGQSGSTDGPEFMNASSFVSFQVDEKPPHHAARPEYIQSTFHVAVSNKLLMEMAAGSRLVMRYGSEPYQRKIFTLRGSQNALNKVDCNPLE